MSMRPLKNGRPSSRCRGPWLAKTTRAEAVATRRQVAEPGLARTLCRDGRCRAGDPHRSANGYGKRTSSYEYRITNRGGKGIVAMTVNERNGPLVASFPVEENDQIMLVTDGGQLIRCPVDDIRKAGRSTQGRHRHRHGR